MFLKGCKFKAYKRDLSLALKNYKEFAKHLLRKASEETQKTHLKEHAQRGL